MLHRTLLVGLLFSTASLAEEEIALAAEERPADATAAPRPERRLGDPIPLTERELTLQMLEVEVAARYGLVGTGPTRFTNDIRLGVLDWLEVRTALLPYPSALMLRARLGDIAGPFGSFFLEGGLAHFDAGLRLVPDAGEAEVGLRFHLEAVAGFAWTFAPGLSAFVAAHYRERLSLLRDDDQRTVAATASFTYDLLPWLALTAGAGYAQAVTTPVREIAVAFVETGRPGFSHFLLREDRQSLDEELRGYSVTIPISMTYGRTESFDVDLFCTTRIWPKLDVLFGAGLRVRYGFL